ncbi:SusC/RagA family TonB-linked outer membrane protein [Pedobacter sp. PWIIR3]
MKLTTLIMILFLLQVAAAGKAQITINANKAKLQAVLEKISEQSGYDFVYSDNDFKNTRAVNVKLNNATIERALEVCFANQPLSYQISEKTVIVKRKEEKGIIENIVDRFQAIDVRGRVVDERGNPLPGVSVSLKGGRSTSTDKEGNFYLAKVNEDAVLVISYLGYLTKEVGANIDLSNIVLEVSNSKLDEVQIIAYGTTSRRLSTGNTNGITTKDINNSPTNNPILALQGRVPGIFINQSSGVAGSGIVVNIQGVNSISKGTDPFYVVDGVPYTSQLLPTIANILGGPSFSGAEQIGQGSPLSYLNPADIESIEVLKDADATAIYGSRAANGAILITTKKGSFGKTIVDGTFQVGVGRVPHKLKMLNTQQYLEMRKEAYKNDALAIPSQLIPSNQKNLTNYDLTIWDQNRYTNWQEELIGKAASYNDAQLSISGGSNLTTFRLNSGYHRETTVFPGKFSDNKASLGLNVNHSSMDNKFKVSFSGTYLNDKNALPNQDLTPSALSLAPNAPALYRNDGSLNWERIPSGADSVSTFYNNPLRYYVNTYLVQTNNLIANSTLSYEILNGLSLRANLGYTDMTSREVATFPLTSKTPETQSFYSRLSQFGNGRIDSWIIEPQILYNLQIAKGIGNFLMGTTFQNTEKQLQSITASGYSNDQTMADYSSAATITTNPGILSTYRYSAIFARFNYNWGDKYIINLTARRDGSSRFGAKNKFENFGAVGGAWQFTNEDFLKSKISFISFGKIRASYGTTGNDQIGDYQYLNQYISIPGYIAALPYQGIVGLQPNSLPNPYLQWELTKKMQLGVDIGFFDNRILAGVGYYRNCSSNQLIGYSLADQSGFESITKNFPAKVENRGWEITLNSKNFNGRYFTWSTNFNITSNANKLIEFPNLSESSYASLLILNQPLDVKRVYDYAGVDSKTGLYQFKGINGNLTIAPTADDLTKYVHPSPKFYGGLQNDFSFRGFELNVLIQFVKQQRQNLRLGTTFRNGTAWNEPIQVLDRWQKDGDLAEIQKFSTRLLLSNIGNSNFAYTDASYARIKNVSLSYTLPGKVLKSLKIDRCRVFAQGQNIFTVTKYIGLDPENSTFNNLPPLRVITFGLQVTL